jgi:hypothetical protein
VIPQLLGGYIPQINLANSGTYYSLYYTQPQDVAAIDWLGNQSGTLPAGVQAENITDRYYFSAAGEVAGTQAVSDIFPTILKTSSWVVLGRSTVQHDDAFSIFNGDLVEYRYPLQLLQNTKDRVYDNGSTVIYH